MARIKIDNTGSILCSSCRSGVVTERKAGRITVYCNSMRKYVPSDIARCSDYEDKRVPEKWDYEQIAWTIQHDKGGRMIGFKPPKRDE